MFRKVACAAVVLMFCVGVAMSEEIFGRITKIEDGTITVVKFKSKETVELKLASKVKVLNAKFNREDKSVEVGKAIEGGLKNERFKKLSKFGVAARIITNDDGKVTEIHAFPPFKGKGKGKKKD